MRLGVLEHGQPRLAKVAMGVARTVSRSDLDDVAKASLYRPELFGRAWLSLVREVMRGQSPWTPAERELLGAFVSRLNRCSYCVAVHSKIAVLGLGRTVTTEDLDAWVGAGFGDCLTATMGLLEKVVTRPGEVGPADMEAVREAGVSDDAVIDALHVAFIFCLINRVASALGFSWASEADALKGARILNRIGYRLPAFLLK